MFLHFLIVNDGRPFVLDNPWESLESCAQVLLNPELSRNHHTQYTQHTCMLLHVVLLFILFFFFFFFFNGSIW